MSLKKFIVLPLAWGYKLHFGAANLGAENETTPLMIAVRERSEEQVRAILEQMKSDLHSDQAMIQELGKRDYHGKTALSYALSKNFERGFEPSIEIATLLIDAKADVNGRFETGSVYPTTYLTQACYTGNFQVFKLLLDAGASITGRDERGYNALSYELFYPGDENRLLIADALLSRGFDPNELFSTLDEAQVTFLEWACSKHHVLTVSLLLKYGACPDFDGRSALVGLLQSSYDPGATISIMQLLIVHGANVDVLYPWRNDQNQRDQPDPHTVRQYIRSLSDRYVHLKRSFEQALRERERPLSSTALSNRCRHVSSLFKRTG